MGAQGPLIDGPDYTFLDGRHTPLRKGQRRRVQEQREASVRNSPCLTQNPIALDWGSGSIFNLMLQLIGKKSNKLETNTVLVLLWKIVHCAVHLNLRYPVCNEGVL